ncbi:MAG TPA: L,D-transpeptidase [Candidatus Acidoferrales bacterium]|nr:L,D-transpeptidase [Candidatus Acidoferrales bacterium]
MRRESEGGLGMAVAGLHAALAGFIVLAAHPTSTERLPAANIAIANARLQPVETIPAVVHVKITKPRPARRIVVSVPDKRLILMEDDRVVKIYRVATGATATPSPSGSYRIAQRVSDPTYYHPGKVIVAGADNPLGPRWIGLDTPGYGIHGTNEPASIGHAASHGCIRMRNSDVEDLFERVQEGDAVEIAADRTPEITALLEAVMTNPDSSTQVAAARAQGAAQVIQ